MKGFDSRCYIRVVILFFSVKRTISSTALTKETPTSISHEHIGHKENSIYWSELSSLQKEKEGRDDTEIPALNKSSSLSSPSTSSLSKLRHSFFQNNDSSYEEQLKRQRLCDIGDGYIYHEDEVLGSFETKCGSIEQFPCYCAPDLDPPISCPYCGFRSDTHDGNKKRLQMSKSKNFFCLRDGEISDPFVGSDKQMAAQQCSCDMEGDVPVSNCHSTTPVSEGKYQDDTTIKNMSKPSDSATVDLRNTDSHGNMIKERIVDSEEDVCTLELDSGEIKIFQRGESYGDFLPNECQQPSRFPCKCNPDLYDQIECPYCSFRTDSGDLVCAGHEQTVSFLIPGSETRDVETCTCWVPEDPSNKPFKACTVESYSMDAEDHYGIGDENSGDMKPPQKGCDVTDPATGESILVPFGESFADYLEVEGTCGNGVEWPAYCTAGTTDTAIARFRGKQELQLGDRDMNSSGVYINDRADVAYPYCVFYDTLSGEAVCAKDNGHIVFTNSAEEQIKCSCQYSNSNGGQTVCSPYLALQTSELSATDHHSMRGRSRESSDASVSVFNGMIRGTIVYVLLGHVLTILL